MAVRYRFDATSAWNYINNADSFSNSPVAKECWGNKIFPAVYINVEIWSNFTGAKWYSSFDGSSPISNYGQLGYRFQGYRLSASRQIIHFDYLTLAGSVVTHDYTYSRGLYVKRSELAYVTYCYRYTNPQTGQVTEEVINPTNFNASSKAVDGNTCTSPSCTFRAYQQGNLILELTYPTCPQAEIVTNQCPPNTCDVLCGDTICCYGADGISVFNYPNT